MSRTQCAAHLTSDTQTYIFMIVETVVLLQYTENLLIAVCTFHRKRDNERRNTWRWHWC